VTRGELTAELAALLGLRHEARFIVEDVLGSGPSGSGREVTPDDVTTIRTLAARRRAGEPLQYILGHWAFRTLDLLVDPRVLIPRPETEQVVEVALGELDKLGVVAPAVVDAGTGSGAIVLSLASELADRHPAARLWATDASGDALAVARENLERVRNQHGEKVLPVRFVQGSWLHALPTDLRASINLIVANPPYVAADEWSDLPCDVQREPYGALVAEAGTEGTPGLADVEQLLEQARAWLSRPGVIVIEMAPHQIAAAVQLARSMGYADVRVEEDLAQRQRALVARVR
jgi:release factor glutamine methyltransferase